MIASRRRSAAGWLLAASLGACTRSGSLVCNGANATKCSVTAGTPSAETCGNTIDEDCNEVWSVPLGEQITGSIGVSADNGEIYASTGRTIYQVLDAGDTASVAWSADLDVFDLEEGQAVFNQNLAGVGANGIAFQAGAGVQIGAQRLTLTTGVGLLDRATGRVRTFAPGLDETVAVRSTGPVSVTIESSSCARPRTIALTALAFTSCHPDQSASLAPMR